MKTPVALTMALAAVAAVLPLGAEMPASPKIQSMDLLVEGAFTDIGLLMAAQMRKDLPGGLELGPELQRWMRDNRPWLTEQWLALKSAVPTRQWPLTQVANRLPLPAVFAGTGSYVPSIDRCWSLHVLAKDRKSAAAILRYAVFWSFVFETDPELAFSWLQKKSTDSEVSTTDIIELQGTLDYWQGGKLKAPLSKQTWQELHKSTNPLNRFIALEKFDSVEQSPAELLALYRECLFGACSYLEVRALEGITRNKDFREDVARLLEEYIASNPPADDGSLPKLRNNFPDLVEGAKRVITLIRNKGIPPAPPPPQPDPFAPAPSKD